MFPKVTPFRIFLAIICIFIVGSLFRYSNQPVEYTYSSFIRSLEKNEVKSVHMQGQKLDVLYKDGTRAVTYGTRYDAINAEKILAKKDVMLSIEPYKDYSVMYLLFNGLVNLIIMAFIIYANMMRSPFFMNREKKPRQNNVSFDDIAGLASQKRELVKIVKIMQNPNILLEIGAKIPKGVLLLGPPGTGKTLLARALATETKTSFLYVSGSEFIEMFVGVGPSRIRDLFKRAEAQKPCIIFIDEIDSIGSKRGNILRDGGMNERENTLNQLLVEMDGFQQKSGILVIAATNRAEILDGALLRPGRFDIQINIPLPMSRERLDTFKLYLGKCKVHPDGINLKNVIRETAELPTSAIETIVNKAAIHAAVRYIEQTNTSISQGGNIQKYDVESYEKTEDMQKDIVSEIVEQIKSNNTNTTKSHIDSSLGILQEDLNKAAHEFLMGIYSEHQFTYEVRKRTAYHEAGHAIIAHYLDSDLIKEATIIPTDKALGMVTLLPKDEDPVSHSRSWYENRIAVLLGGIKAEEKLYGKSETSSGAVSDLRSVMQIAQSMIMYYAMHDDSCENQGEDYLGYMQYMTNVYQEDLRGPETRNMCDRAIRRLINRIANKVDEMFIQYEAQWRKVAETLLELNRLTGKQLSLVIENYTLDLEELKAKFPNEVDSVDVIDSIYIYKPVAI